jgi:hypothetical protein
VASDQTAACRNGRGSRGCCCSYAPAAVSKLLSAATQHNIGYLSGTSMFTAWLVLHYQGHVLEPHAHMPSVHACHQHTPRQCLQAGTAVAAMFKQQCSLPGLSYIVIGCPCLKSLQDMRTCLNNINRHDVDESLHAAAVVIWVPAVAAAWRSMWKMYCCCVAVISTRLTSACSASGMSHLQQLAVNRMSMSQTVSVLRLVMYVCVCHTCQKSTAVLLAFLLGHSFCKLLGLSVGWWFAVVYAYEASQPPTLFCSYALLVSHSSRRPEG